MTVWPHRSLTPRGFRNVMIGAGAAFCFPLVPLVFTKFFWGLAPFAFTAWAALGLFIKRNYRDGRLVEELTLWPDLVVVERREPGGKILRWEANPYWVEMQLHPGHKLENYLTLRGNGRTIELGAFLSPEERVDLHAELEEAFALARMSPDAESWRPDGA